MVIGIGTVLALLGGAAGAGGVYSGARGVKKFFRSSKKNKELQKKLEKMADELEKLNESSIGKMDELGHLELKIMETFSDFSALLEKISNKPEFDELILEEFNIPEFNDHEIEKVSTGAASLLAGASGMATGALGGFAAAGAAKSAVFAFGTASTGTAISSLSGAALTNATLAALGGGSLAAGGGGIALGSTMLGFSTLGIGLLIGGSIFNKVGDNVEGKVANMEETVKEVEKEYKELKDYLVKLENNADKYKKTLYKVNAEYEKRLSITDYIVNFSGKTDYNLFTDKEKKTLENLVLLTGMLYNMCQLNIVIETEEDELNKVNEAQIDYVIEEAEEVLDAVAASA